MDWLGFLESILGGLIGGLFSFFGVHLTIKHSEKKEKEEALKITLDTKPRLEISKYIGFEDSKNIKEKKYDCNILLLNIKQFINDGERARFIYDSKALNQENLVFVEYELKNIGLTEITDFCVTCNFQKNISAIKYEDKDLFIKENLLNYDVWANKRYIKPGQSINLRVYFIDGQIWQRDIVNSSILTLWLCDTNNRYWSQSLNAPYNEVEISILRQYIDFRNARDIDKAIECFKNPRLW